MAEPRPVGPPLRVAHVLWRLTARAGVPVVVRRMADRIDPAAVDLHVVQGRAELADDRLAEVPATVHALGAPPGATPLSRLRTMALVGSKLRSLRPAVVQLHSGTVWMSLWGWVLLRKVGWVLEVHDAPGSGRHGRWTDRLEGWWVRRSGAVLVAHSTSVASDTLRAWRLPADRVVTFPLAVDVGRFRPPAPNEGSARAEWRTAHDIDASAFVMIAVGRVQPAKRFDLAIDALARVRAAGVDAALVVVGHGGSHDALREHARGLGVEGSVHLLGGVPDDEFVAALQAADVLCSTSEYEGFGLTLIEGMACGLPVVAMAVGGVTDIVVEGETGFLVPSGDVDAFADRVRRLAVDGLRGPLGAAAAERAEQLYGPDALAQAFTAVYRRAAGGG